MPWAKMPNDALVAAEDPRGDLPVPRLVDSRSRSRTCRRRRSSTSSAPQKDEKVLVRYRHERGENTYKATFEGIVTNLERRYRETDSEYIKTELEKYMVTRPCPTCGGKRLKPEVLAVTVDGRNISDVATLSITDALAWVERAAEAADASASGRSPTRCSRRSRRGSASSSTSASTT